MEERTFPLSYNNGSHHVLMHINKGTHTERKGNALMRLNFQHSRLLKGKEFVNNFMGELGNI